MKRNIAIVTTRSSNKNFPDFSSVAYTNIDSVVNNSVDVLYCDILNEISGAEAGILLEELFKKMRLGGQIVFIITNMQYVATEYGSGSLTDAEFLNYIGGVKNIVSIQFLDKILQDHEDLSLLSREDKEDKIAIVMQKVKI